MIANDSIIHRLRIPRECIYFPGSRHSKWIDCGLYSNNTCKRLTDTKGAQEGGMDARIICKKKMKVCAYPWSYLAVTRIPELAWESQRFLHFLKKHGKPFTWETKGRFG